jgi:hypothetical protein
MMVDVDVVVVVDVVMVVVMIVVVDVVMVVVVIILEISKIHILARSEKIIKGKMVDKVVRKMRIFVIAVEAKTIGLVPVAHPNI